MGLFWFFFNKWIHIGLRFFSESSWFKLGQFCRVFRLYYRFMGSALYFSSQSDFFIKQLFFLHRINILSLRYCFFTKINLAEIGILKIHSFHLKWKSIVAKNLSTLSIKEWTFYCRIIWENNILYYTIGNENLFILFDLF